MASGSADAFLDGDSTPLGQRFLSVLPVVYRLWAVGFVGLGHLEVGFEVGCPNLPSVWGMVFFG